MKIENEQRLTPLDFALIKEYLGVGGSYDGISKVTGLNKAQVMEIDHIKEFVDYQKIQDDRITQGILNE